MPREESELFSQQGLPVYLVSSKYNLRCKTRLRIDFNAKDALEPRLFWRSASAAATSSELGCELSLLESISQPQPVIPGPLLQQQQSTHRDRVNATTIGDDAVSAVEESSERGFSLALLFPDFKLVIEVFPPKESDRDSYANEFRALLIDSQKRAQNFQRIEREKNTPHNYQQSLSFSRAALSCCVKEEQLLQLCLYLRFKEGYMLIERAVSSTRSAAKFAAFRRWVVAIRDCNDVKMTRDRNRWRLHAAANQDIDLQAWYHALFYQEVYRLRGHFWYKDAVLPVYKQSYDLVDNALTPLEEAALAHVLCSPDTTYGDVAGQMFVVQALIAPPQFALFQQLAAQGATVVKYPRSGRPSKKLFRFSFVEGNIYLTWKGKFGNQGVGMGEVTEVRAHNTTDNNSSSGNSNSNSSGGADAAAMQKWFAQGARPEQFLSVNCVDRSVDLYFDSQQERDSWQQLLQTLVAKERGHLLGVEAVDPAEAAAEFEWLILYASIGKTRQETI